MNVQQLAEHFGTQVAAANALGVTDKAVSAWKKRGIPLVRQYQIQVVTGGRLQAGMAHGVAPAAKKGGAA
jgi:metal-dependent amidase/aminoacylase/carboxypeptidase family protein